MHGDGDIAAEARQGLVHAVVENLEHEVVESPGIGIPYVHVGAFSYGFKARKNLYLLGGVIVAQTVILPQFAHCFGFLRLAQNKYLPVRDIVIIMIPEKKEKVRNIRQFA